MAKKKSRTKTTSHLNWAEYIRLAECLRKDQEWLMWGTIVLGVSFALRVSDLLDIKWNDLLDDVGDPAKSIKVFERKTAKSKRSPRIITFSPDVRDIIWKFFKETNSCGLKEYAFSKDRKTRITVRILNYQLKKIFKKYEVDYHGNVSTHLFRKTFGRRYAELHDFDMKSISILQSLFRHKDMKTTMVYLGIDQREVAQVYTDVCVM